MPSLGPAPDPSSSLGRGTGGCELVARFEAPTEASLPGGAPVGWTVTLRNAGRAACPATTVSLERHAGSRAAGSPERIGGRQRVSAIPPGRSATVHVREANAPAEGTFTYTLAFLPAVQEATTPDLSRTVSFRADAKGSPQTRMAVAPGPAVKPGPLGAAQYATAETSLFVVVGSAVHSLGGRQCWPGQLIVAGSRNPDQSLMLTVESPAIGCAGFDHPRGGPASFPCNRMKDRLSLRVAAVGGSIADAEAGIPLEPVLCLGTSAELPGLELMPITVKTRDFGLPGAPEGEFKLPVQLLPPGGLISQAPTPSPASTGALRAGRRARQGPFAAAWEPVSGVTHYEYQLRFKAGDLESGPTVSTSPPAGWARADDASASVPGPLPSEADWLLWVVRGCNATSCGPEVSWARHVPGDPGPEPGGLACKTSEWIDLAWRYDEFVDRARLNGFEISWSGDSDCFIDYQKWLHVPIPGPFDFDAKRTCIFRLFHGRKLATGWTVAAFAFDNEAKWSTKHQQHRWIKKPEIGTQDLSFTLELSNLHGGGAPHETGEALGLRLEHCSLDGEPYSDWRRAVE